MAGEILGRVELLDSLAMGLPIGSHDCAAIPDPTTGDSRYNMAMFMGRVACPDQWI